MRGVRFNPSPPSPVPMACRLGSLFFCADCAALLDAVSASPFVKCSQCGRSYDADQLDGGVITTSASFRAVDRRKEQGEGPQTRARINETCPSCGHEELTFYTMQLRYVIGASYPELT